MCRSEVVDEVVAVVSSGAGGEEGSCTEGAGGRRLVLRGLRGGGRRIGGWAWAVCS